MSRSRPSKASAAAAAMIAEPAPHLDIKGSINLRIDGQSRHLIDEAAEILGKNRTEFMIESARVRAIDVLLDQRLFVLEPAAFDAFVDALEMPAAPDARLQALLRRPAPWKE